MRPKGSRDFRTQEPETKEVIDDLAFLDGQREEVDLFQGLDLAIFHETNQLSDGNPLFLLFLATTTASTSAAPEIKAEEK